MGLKICEGGLEIRKLTSKSVEFGMGRFNFGVMRNDKANPHRATNSYEESKWDQILVGDFIRIENDELIPADALIVR